MKLKQPTFTKGDICYFDLLGKSGYNFFLCIVISVIGKKAFILDPDNNIHKVPIKYLTPYNMDKIANSDDQVAVIRKGYDVRFDEKDCDLLLKVMEFINNESYMANKTGEEIVAKSFIKMINKKDAAAMTEENEYRIKVLGIINGTLNIILNKIQRAVEGDKLDTQITFCNSIKKDVVKEMESIKKIKESFSDLFPGTINPTSKPKNDTGEKDETLLDRYKEWEKRQKESPNSNITEEELDEFEEKLKKRDFKIDTNGIFNNIDEKEVLVGKAFAFNGYTEFSSCLDFASKIYKKVNTEGIMMLSYALDLTKDYYSDFYKSNYDEGHYVLASDLLNKMKEDGVYKMKHNMILSGTSERDIALTILSIFDRDFINFKDQKICSPVVPCFVIMIDPNKISEEDLEKFKEEYGDVSEIPGDPEFEYNDNEEEEYNE